MKIVFMGTPDFAVPSLDALIQNGFNIEAVVTAPDKERGRGREMSVTPIKKYALDQKLEVLAPFSLKDERFISRLRAINPDLMIIVAFRILPKEVYSISRIGTFNLHGSLLPRYRGAAPIQWAIFNGDTETGVTTFFLEDKIDTGNIILQEKLLIEPEDNFGTLHDKMMVLGAETMLRTVNLINSGNFKLRKQNDSLSSFAPKITKETCLIDLNKSAVYIHNLIRGLSPYPGAVLQFNGKSYKILKSRIPEMEGAGREHRGIHDSLPAVSPQGSASRLFQSKKEIFIETSAGVLEILELQPEGRKRMTTEEFLRGYTFVK